MKHIAVAIGVLLPLIVLVPGANSKRAYANLRTRLLSPKVIRRKAQDSPTLGLETEDVEAERNRGRKPKSMPTMKGQKLKQTGPSLSTKSPPTPPNGSRSSEPLATPPSIDTSTTPLVPAPTLAPVFTPPTVIPLPQSNAAATGPSSDLGPSSDKPPADFSRAPHPTYHPADASTRLSYTLRSALDTTEPTVERSVASSAEPSTGPTAGPSTGPTPGPTLEGCFTGTGPEVTAMCAAASNNSCCSGLSACNFEITATICPNACHGNFACLFLGMANRTAALVNDIVIGHDSCNLSNSCIRFAGSSGRDSCQGILACAEGTGNVGTRSCNANQSCARNEGEVSRNSCNGNQACIGNKRDIGFNECNSVLECT